MELLQLLTDNLGVSQEQAQGGTGLLFNLAKEKLSSGDFQQVADAVPGIDDLMGKAPSGGSAMGALGGLASSIGGGSIGNLAGLAAGFSQLNLDSGMITKFVPVILSFVQSKGGDGVKGLLASVFK